MLHRIGRLGRETGGSNQGWGVVAIMALVNLVVCVDYLGVSVLLPKIGEDLGAGTSGLVWMTNAYFLMLVAPLVGAGRLADAVGHRRLTMIGLAMFVIGSVTAVFARDIGVLVAARSMVGLAVAALTATGLAIVSDALPAEKRGRAIGIWAAIGAVGSALGPFLAGAVALKLDWRAFFVLTTLGALVALVLTCVFIRESARGVGRFRDLPLASVGLLTAGLALAAFGLIQGPQWGWTATSVLVALVAGAVLLVAFWRVDRNSADPLVDPEVLRMSAFRGAATVAFIGNFAFATMTFFVSLYLQRVLDLDPGMVGLIFLALTVPLILVSPAAGYLVERVWSGLLMVIGLLLVAASFLVLANLGLTAAPLLIAAGLLLSGCGQGLIYNVSDVVGMEALPAQKSGIASGLINGIRQLGSLVGLAIAEALFISVYRDGTGTASENFVAALGPTMLLVVFVALAGIIPALLVPKFRSGRARQDS